MPESDEDYVQRRLRDAHPYEKVEQNPASKFPDRSLEMQGVDGGYLNYSAPSPRPFVPLDAGPASSNAATIALIAVINGTGYNGVFTATIGDPI
jgi:hypothetical protein